METGAKRLSIIVIYTPLDAWYSAFSSLVRVESFILPIQEKLKLAQLTSLLARKEVVPEFTVCLLCLR